MALGKRITRLMRAFIEEQWERLESLVREEEAEAHARAEAMRELEDDLRGRGASAPTRHSTPSAEPTDPVRRAYKVLGLPENADLATVRHTYRTLASKSDPHRFPEGSPERTKAELIHAQIEEAYRTLLRHLDPSADRFHDLELP